MCAADQTVVQTQLWTGWKVKTKPGRLETGHQCPDGVHSLNLRTIFTDVGFNLCHFIIGALGNMGATDSIIIMIFMCVVFARGSASDKEMD